MKNNSCEQQVQRFSTLNNLYRRLFNLELDIYKNALNFVTQFKGIYIKITNICLTFKLKTNFFIFLFYLNLNKFYNVYFIHYIQEHKSINDKNI